MSSIQSLEAKTWDLEEGALEIFMDVSVAELSFYYGVPIPVEIVERKCESIKKRADIPEDYGTVDFLMDLTGCLEGDDTIQPYACAMHTVVPKDMRNSTAEDHCYVFPSVFCKEINWSWINETVSANWSRILKDIFEDIGWTPGSPQWFFGGGFYTEALDIEFGQQTQDTIDVEAERRRQDFERAEAGVFKHNSDNVIEGLAAGVKTTLKIL